MKRSGKIEWSEFVSQRNSSIVKEISENSKDYILTVDEDKYLGYLHDKYKLEELRILKDKEFFERPIIKKETRNNRAWNEVFTVDVYYFEIKFPFEGSSELFHVRPTTYTLDTYDVQVYDKEGIVSFIFGMEKQDPVRFQQLKKECFFKAFKNVENINKDVRTRWMNSYQLIIGREFSKVKNKYLNENKFFEAINLKVNPETKNVFSVPLIKKKIVPQPKPRNDKRLLIEPGISFEIYEDIIKLLYQTGKNMEKKPSLYHGKDEEGLRDQFLLFLETRYDRVSATGETFNRSGKTDILLQYEDGTNLFIAECKFWTGKKDFLKAINQLFDRYLSWRDTKTALMLFVKNKDMSNVIKEILDNISSHEYFKEELGKNGETSFSYKFYLPQDRDKEVYLEIIAFHFDKQVLLPTQRMRSCCPMVNQILIVNGVDLR